MAEPTGENILKVLSGNQYGVEVALADGTYSFGSGGEADIQLLDVSLLPLHGQVRLRDGKVELRTSGGELVTSSGLVLTKDDADWHEIAQMDAISAGTSKFVIGSAGANWSALVTPQSAKPAPAKGLGDLMAVLQGVPRRVAVVAGGGVAVLALLAVLAGGGGDAAPRADADAGAAFAALRDSVAAMPFARQVSVTERADGTLAVEGYVEEQVERRAIQNALDQSGLPGTLRIFVRQNLRADIDGTIQSLQVPASYTLDEAGNLTLTGTVLDPAEAERLVQTIETGVFGLASVKSEIRTADAILADLRDLATKSGLADLVIFRLDGLVVEATGIVPRDKMDNWAGLMGVYSRRFAKEIPLRSFVTLDQPAASGVAPIIIGTGPVAEAQSGRVVAPEALAEPSEVDAQSLFAGQPAVAPASQGTDDGADVGDNLTAALKRLKDLRPDLFRAIEADVKAGRIPDIQLMRDAMAVLGGSLKNTGKTVDGQPEILVQTADFGALGTLQAMAQRLPDAFAALRQGGAARPEAAAPVAEALPLAAAEAPQDVVPTAPPAVAAEPAPAPAVVAEAPALAAESVQAEGATAAPAPVVAEAPAPAQPAVVADAAPIGAEASRLMLAAETGTASTGSEAQASPPPVAQPEGDVVATETVGQTKVPLYALSGMESLSLGQMMAAADKVIGDKSDATKAAVSPGLRALVEMQHEQLAMGRTLIRLPRPLSALPYSAERPVGCWEGARLTPAILPIALLALDVMSVSSDTDMMRSDPALRDVLMETALSPQRVRACLSKTGSSYAQMVADSSAFLAEIDRNPGFSEFLFRNIQRADLGVAGVSLVGERYVELTDGRKLREGGAPDITSRIMAIGDMGLLLRTAEGTKVQLFGDNLGWRVVDACGPKGCGVN